MSSYLVERLEKHLLSLVFHGTCTGLSQELQRGPVSLHLLIVFPFLKVQAALDSIMIQKTPNSLCQSFLRIHLFPEIIRW